MVGIWRCGFEFGVLVDDELVSGEGLFSPYLSFFLVFVFVFFILLLGFVLTEFSNCRTCRWHYIALHFVFHCLQHPRYASGSCGGYTTSLLPFLLLSSLFFPHFFVCLHLSRFTNENPSRAIFYMMFVMLLYPYSCVRCSDITSVVLFFSFSLFSHPPSSEFHDFISLLCSFF